MKEEKVQVSIVCNTYNQEKYIGQTLESLVSQKCSFIYEILVHDDASTDGTPEIIKKYQERYPTIIKPYFQKENQYSKGVQLTKLYQFSRVNGKYIAFCEGDDYWTDPNKLQMEYDYLENHHECSMVCHAYNLISEDDKKIIEIIRPQKNSGILPVETVMGYEIPTQIATQMFRSEHLLEMPSLYENRGVSDYPYLLYVSTKGYVYYIDKVMANKREASTGSWTERLRNDKKYQLQHCMRMFDFLNDFNKYTNFKYQEYLENRIIYFDWWIAMLTYDYKRAKRNKKYQSASFIRRTITQIGCLFPSGTKKLEQSVFH